MPDTCRETWWSRPRWRARHLSMGRARPSARAVLVTIIVVAAVLTCVAGIAAALGLEGWWVPAVGVALALVALGLRIWTDVLTPKRETRACRGN